MSLLDRAQRHLVHSIMSRYRSGARRGLWPHTFARSKMSRYRSGARRGLWPHTFARSKMSRYRSGARRGLWPHTFARLIRVAVAAAMLSAAALGCVSLKPVFLDRKTQLENQVLGSFQRLEQDLILASSVRGERPAPKLTPLQREAVEAMMSRAFNKDDVDALKQEQVVGEANTGLLSIRTQPKVPALVKRVTDLVQQENRDRMVIIKRVIQLDPQLSDKDLPEVKRIFYRLNLQTAQPGDLVQREAGDWETARKRGGGTK